MSNLIVQIIIVQYKYYLHTKILTYLIILQIIDFIYFSPIFTTYMSLSRV